MNSKLRTAIIFIFIFSLVRFGYADDGNIPSQNSASNKTAKTENTPVAFISPSSYDTGSRAMLNEDVRYLEPEASGMDMLVKMAREKRVRLSIDISQAYDSNIYLTKDNVQDDFITHITPGIYGYIGSGDQMLMGFYEADILIYGKHQKLNTINQTLGARGYAPGVNYDSNDVNQTIGISGAIPVVSFDTGKTSVSFKDTLRPTTVPPSSEMAPFVKRVGNDFGFTVKHDISRKTSLGFTYDQVLEYYITDAYKGNNYIQHVFSPTFYYHISPKTSITGEYNLGVTNYMGGDNYNSLYNQARLGIEGRLTPKSTIALKAGFQQRSYSSSGIKDAYAFVMTGIYDYKISPKTTLELIGSSNIIESVYEGDPYYKSLSFYANLRHHILYNLDLSLAGFYLNNSYPNRTFTETQGYVRRVDNLYGFSSKLTYRFRYWCSAYASYDFKTRDSNTRELTYVDNIVSCGISLSF